MSRLPVTVVTGFLGSGKTTLLRRVLMDPSMKHTAVLVNELGEEGLDHHLLRRVDEKTVLLGNGCLCCTTREDLASALLQLLDLGQRGDLDRIVVETTGLADPAPILFTVYTDPVLQHHFSVENVISTVDAFNGHAHLDNNPESVKQVAASDKVVVTKTDMARPEEVETLVYRLEGINPSATVIRASFGEVEVQTLLRPEAVSRREASRPPLHGHGTGETHSVSLTFDGPVDWTAFGVWLSMLLHARGEEVLRVKGFLDTGGPGPVVLNGVQHIIHPPEHLEGWPDEDRRSRVVFITRGIEGTEILASLEAFAILLEANPLPLRRTSAAATTSR